MLHSGRDAQQEDKPDCMALLQSVDRLLGTLKTVSDPVELPEKDPAIWKQAALDGEKGLKDALATRSKLHISRPGHLSVRSGARQADDQYRDALQGRAEAAYRKLDTAFAKAEEHAKKTIDKRIREFDVLLTHVREIVGEVPLGREPHPFLVQGLPVVDYSGKDLLLSQQQWHDLWQQEGPKITHDLECIRSYLEYRAKSTSVDKAAEVNRSRTASAQDIAGKLENLRQQGERYTSQRDMAKRLNCAPGTISNAVKSSDKLKQWAAKPRIGAPRAVPLTDVTADQTAQTRETDPSDVVTADEVAAAVAEILDKASESERAEINAMGPEQHRQLAELHIDQKPDDSNPISHKRV